MAGPSCGELPGCLGPHFLSTKCPTSLEQSGASQTLHPPAVTPGTVSGLGGAPPGIWQLWAPTHYCKPLWTAPTPRHLPPAELPQVNPHRPPQWSSWVCPASVCWRASQIRPAAAPGTQPNAVRTLPSSPQAPWSRRRLCWLHTALGRGPPRQAQLRGNCEGTVAPPAHAIHTSRREWGPQHSSGEPRGATRLSPEQQKAE